MHRFEAAVNIDALLGAVRDYFERVTREFHVKGSSPQQPRDVEVSMPRTMPLSSICKQSTSGLSDCRPATPMLRKRGCISTMPCVHAGGSVTGGAAGSTGSLGDLHLWAAQDLQGACPVGMHTTNVAAEHALHGGQVVCIATAPCRAARAFVLSIINTLYAEPVSEAVVHGGRRRRCGALLHRR